MKKYISGFITGIIIASVLSVGAATGFTFILSPDQLYINGDKVDKPLYSYQDTNYIPLRAAAETLGLDIGYYKGRIDLTSKPTDIETVALNVKSCVLIRVYDSTDISTARLVGTASGVVVKEGIIVTNKHVTAAGKMFGIQFQDTAADVEYKTTEIISIDTNLDISFLRLSYADKPVMLGDSDKSVIGQEIIAISSPGGLKNQISEGIISGLTKEIYGKSIQVNADMSAGSSGGGVFDMRSKLIGIYSSTLTDNPNYHFIIAINDIKPLIESLKSRYEP